MAQFFKPQKKKTLNTKHKELTVLRLDHQGDGLAFDHQKPVFISGALPSETVVVQLTEDKRQYARAKLIKVLTPSESRVTPFCPHYQTCGGCQLQHLAPNAQVAAKQETLSQLMKKFAAADLVQAPPIIGETLAYRRRTRLSVKVDSSGTLQMGFRQRGRHDIVTVTDCPVLNRSLNALLPSLYQVLDGLRGRRIIGHIELVDAHAGPVLLVRAIKCLHQEDIQTLTDFSNQHQLTLYLEQGESEPQQICGQTPQYQAMNCTFAFEPKDFIQVNDSVNQKMLAQALTWLSLEKTDTILDLFCGLGNFSLPLAKHAARVIGVEGVPDMVQRATENADLNCLKNVTFHHANLEDDKAGIEWQSMQFDKILLDPARAGALGVMPYVAKSGASHVVYVSCNPVTLARDSQVLLENGYRLKRLGMLDMFPHTGHLESMALFIRD